MAQFSIEINGHRRGAKRLNKIEKAVSDRNIDRLTRNYMRRMIRSLQREPYPSKIPGQVYVRTYRLRDSWHQKKQRPGVYEIYNDAFDPEHREYYAAHVVGDATGRGQDPNYHAGRWWKARTVIDRRKGELPRDVIKAIQKAGA